MNKYLNLNKDIQTKLYIRTKAIILNIIDITRLCYTYVSFYINGYIK